MEEFDDDKPYYSISDYNNMKEELETKIEELATKIEELEEMLENGKKIW